MFERQYVLRSFDWTARESMTDAINEAVRACDHEHAAASIACMTNDGSQLHILIEQWRDCGDSEQDPAPAVEPSAKRRKPRRSRATEDDDSAAAARVEPQGLDLPLEQAEVGPESA